MPTSRLCRGIGRKALSNIPARGLLLMRQRNCAESAAWTWARALEFGSGTLLCAVALVHGVVLLEPRREYLSFDDPTNYVHNLYVQNGLGWNTLRWIVWDDGILLGVWEPVSLLWRAGCWRIFGGEPEATLAVYRRNTVIG